MQMPGYRDVLQLAPVRLRSVCCPVCCIFCSSIVVHRCMRSLWKMLSPKAFRHAMAHQGEVLHPAIINSVDVHSTGPPCVRLPSSRSAFVCRCSALDVQLDLPREGTD
eukprot:5473834-Amphidinium_carterae.2